MDRAGMLRRHWWLIATMLALLALLVAGGSRSLMAQDATPDAGAATADEGRPIHIHSGNCAEGELGDVVVPLTNLTAPTGTASGQDDLATVVETSVTNVPMALEDILAEDHAINAHLSVEEVTTYIACGEVGGTVSDADGSLTIGLREVGDSGFSGIAYLAPGADPATTDVSVFIAEGLAGGEAATEDEGATEEAASGDTVAVSLSEFVIDMPSELPAGPTTFEVTNDGTFPHSFEIEGQGIEEELEANLEPGQSGTLEVDLEPGTYEVYCPVGNHADQGMTLELTVTE